MMMIITLRIFFSNRYDKKPLFRYSGCHMYDTSAFNVALGLMFGPDHHPYQPPEPPAFTRVPSTASAVDSSKIQFSSPSPMVHNVVHSLPWYRHTSRTSSIAAKKTHHSLSSKNTCSSRLTFFNVIIFFCCALHCCLCTRLYIQFSFII